MQPTHRTPDQAPTDTREDRFRRLVEHLQDHPEVPTKAQPEGAGYHHAGPSTTRAPSEAQVSEGTAAVQPPQGVPRASGNVQHSGSTDTGGGDPPRSTQLGSSTDPGTVTPQLHPEDEQGPSPPQRKSKNQGVPPSKPDRSHQDQRREHERGDQNPVEQLPDQLYKGSHQDRLSDQGGPKTSRH